MDTALLEEVSNFTRVRLLPLDRECSSTLDHLTDEFFAPALQRYRALVTILPSEEASNWLVMHQNEYGWPSPLTVFPTTHSAGLNFSRSWGLWTLYLHTRDPAYRDLYAKHIMTHMSMPQYWRDDYRKYGHWVPQFGIYGIVLSMETDSI